MRIRIRKSFRDDDVAFVCVHRSFAGESFFSTRSKIVHSLRAACVCLSMSVSVFMSMCGLHLLLFELGSRSLSIEYQVMHFEFRSVTCGYLSSPRAFCLRSRSSRPRGVCVPRAQAESSSAFVSYRIRSVENRKSDTCSFVPTLSSHNWIFISLLQLGPSAVQYKHFTQAHTHTYTHIARHTRTLIEWQWMKGIALDTRYLDTDTNVSGMAYARFPNEFRMLGVCAPMSVCINM